MGAGAIATFGLTGCRGASIESIAPEPVAAFPGLGDPPLQVDAAWLRERRAGVDADHLVILDLSDLPTYREGHVPGAIHTWWQDWIDPYSDIYGVLLGTRNDPNAREDLLGRMGIDNDSTVVAYDADQNRYAAHMVWILRYFGLRQASILDGGLGAWRGAGESSSKDGVDPREAGAVTLSVEPDWTIPFDEMVDRYADPNLTIVDVRTEDEADDDLNGLLHRGMIPGSIRLPWTNSLRDKAGRLLAPEVLAGQFRDAGILPEDEVCGGGALWGGGGTDLACSLSPWIRTRSRLRPWLGSLGPEGPRPGDRRIDATHLDKRSGTSSPVARSHTLQRNVKIGGLIVVLLTLANMTASAQESTPEAVPSANVPTVTETREVTFEGRYLSMSPDGKWIATYDNEQDRLCALDTARLGEKVTSPNSDSTDSCLSFEEHGILSIAEDYVRWSPDGTRIAFTENGPVYFHDADIWVFTPETGDVINLTDDGVSEGINFLTDVDAEPFDMDILPTWSPDGQLIAFARSPWNGDWRGTQLMLVPADGSGEADTIGSVALTTPMVVYFGMGFSPDGNTLYYTFAQTDTDDSKNGVWEISLDDFAFRHIAGRTDPERGYPTLAAVSPKGDQLLVFDALFAGQFGLIDTPFGLLDLETGDVEPLLASGPDEPLAVVPVRTAFSPDGEWIVFTGTGTQVSSGLFVRPSSESGPGQDSVLTENTDGETPFIGVSWGSNGTIFVQTSPESGIVLEVSGGSEPPAPPQIHADSTATASPVAAGPVDPTLVQAGTELVTNDASVALHSAPDPDAPVVADLSGGTMLVAIGPVEDAGGFAWIPVREPESGTIGYVRAELVSLAPQT